MNSEADLILYNANVITLDRTRPRATAVAVKGSRIIDVGTDEDTRFHKGTRTEIIDCHGRTVLPGFNDAHCHPIALASSLLSVDCRPSSVRSISDIQTQIHHRAKQTHTGRWIRATGYNEFYLAEKRHPNRWDLDKAAPDHPVKLSHRSGHACVLNSLALKLLQISKETPEPQGGIIERDLETGEPNGLLFEMNPYIEKLMPHLSEEELESGIKLANEEFLSHGITSVQDATWSDSLRRWQILRQSKEQQKLIPRISMMIGMDEIEEFEAGNVCHQRSLDSSLHLGGVKVVLHTATGALNPPQEELNQLVHKAHRLGYQIAFHADEEKAVEAAISALEDVLSQIPRAYHRHRLEHCSVCPPHLMRRLKKVKALVVTQPSFIYYSGERYLATVPPDDLTWLYPIGSLCSNGLRVAAGSDTPVVPLNPLVGIYAAVTRTAETGQCLIPRESISCMETLKLYTIDAAYASFEENIKGSISADKLADLAVLSEDPTKVPPEEIKDIAVAMTIVDGEVVWQRQADE